MKSLVTCQFSGTCLQSENFGENVSLFWLLFWSTLELNIYSFEQDMLKFDQIFSFLAIGQDISKFMKVR
jgi:hypothetical protein